MDARTRKKLLGKASLLMHLIQEHHGAIPAGADYAEILREGQDAITALALPMVVRQASRVKPSAPVEPLPVRWGEPIGDQTLEKMIAEDQKAGLVPRREEVREEFVVWRNVPAWKCQDEQWGIGRGLPTGDAL